MNLLRAFAGTIALCAPLIVLLSAGVSLAEEESAPASAAQADAEASSDEAETRNPGIVRVEELYVILGSQRDEATALERDATNAASGDRVALLAKALDIRLNETRSTILELAEIVQDLESRELEAATYRLELRAILPGFSTTLRQDADDTGESLAKSKEERAAASGDDAALLDQQIRRQEETRGELLAAVVDLSELLVIFELSNELERTWLAESVATRARLMSSRMHMAALRLSDAEEHSASTPDDAALQARVAIEFALLEADASALSHTVALMERLEIDAAQYKQLLLAATGEITTDVFDSDVTGELLSRWTQEATETVAENGPEFVFQTVIFVLILATFWLLSRFVRKVTQHAVEAPHLRFSELLKRMIVTVVSGSVMLLGLLVALSQLGIQVGPALAGLGIAGFVLGFALQDALGNFAAGAMILAYRPYDVGDLIDCAGGVFGRVSDMNLVSTTILTVDNQTRVVPNGKIWGDVITNVTAQKVRRVDLVFGIAYQDDIPKAEAVLASVLKEHPLVLEDPEPIVKLHELGDSSVNFVVRPWCARDDYWDVHWDVTREVKLRFDREGISIPFPQRDVHFFPVVANGPERAAAATDPQIGSTPSIGQSEPD
jgi:small conductance mechanosensitive channel